MVVRGTRSVTVRWAGGAAPTATVQPCRQRCRTDRKKQVWLASSAPCTRRQSHLLIHSFLLSIVHLIFTHAAATECVKLNQHVGEHGVHSHGRAGVSRAGSISIAPCWRTKAAWRHSAATQTMPPAGELRGAGVTPLHMLCGARLESLLAFAVGKQRCGTAACHKHGKLT